MKDHIKELNIVDFLGIIVPGTILVLLIAGDNTNLLLWENYFGANTSLLIKSIFLLIAGYLSGMLLHEIGDCLEKGAWCFHIFDPKAYAANAVGPQRIKEAMLSAGVLTNDRNKREFNYVIHPTIKGIIGIVLTIILFIFATVGFCFAVDSSCRAVDDSIVNAVSVTTYHIIAVLAFGTLLIPSILSLLLWKKYYHEFLGLNRILKKIDVLRQKI